MWSAENITVAITAIISVAAAWWGRQHKKEELAQTGEKLGVEVQSSAQAMLISAAELLRKDVERVSGENDTLRGRVGALEKSDDEKAKKIRDMEAEIEELRKDNAEMTRGVNLLIAQLESKQLLPVWRPPERKK